MSPAPAPGPLSQARLAEIQELASRANDTFTVCVALKDAAAELARRDALVQAPEVRALVERLHEMEQTCIGMRDSETAGEGQEQAWQERAECAHHAADLLASLLEAR